MLAYMRQGQAKEEVRFQQKKARKLARQIKAEANSTGQLEVQQGVKIRQKANWYQKVSDQKRYKGPVNDYNFIFNSSSNLRDSVNPEEELVPVDQEGQQGAPVWKLGENADLTILDFGVKEDKK